MLDLIFLNRKESAELLGIDVNKFDTDVRPYIQHVEWGGRVLFKLEELKNFTESSSSGAEPSIQGHLPVVDKEGVIIQPCDGDTAKLKKTYKKLPKGTQAKLDDLLLRLQNISDKAHGRMKG